MNQIVYKTEQYTTKDIKIMTETLKYANNRHLHFNLIFVFN